MLRAVMTACLVLLCAATASVAEGPVPARRVELTDWKAVYARVEARDSIPARARLGGTLVALAVSEGDSVTAGQPIARIVDEKIAIQLKASDAELEALRAELENARAELKRGEELRARGVTTEQRLDALRTQVNVLENTIAAKQASRRVIEQQAAEGDVLAPLAGRVLSVPVARGAVVMAGETVATIGGGGFYLRLALPERHAGLLHEGAAIAIESAGSAGQGRLAKVYPQIENGRVLADVEVENLDAAFVDARVLVRVPLGRRAALVVPKAALATRAGLDFVTVLADGGRALEVAVVPAAVEEIDGVEMVEIVSGLAEGDLVMIGAEGAAHEQ
ncbi:efflux RND transporter periplasmic adaptor subunit [Phaeovulum vinaykumarii]|uniref:RND family efflux transporter, MFP subunit n=1 Tax=Phaeovulum vinaykumarii TaxID=407234 RepID=A0A1N7M379_9RHOB|nr:efflux RND transporter periplasmic adaptor subunit [Phaeovulum vinaykumarii]SIS80575.1 RND family efflux transporter, MFP subunit [Phaeovulum vinaykumarii]SOC09127.1 RND family efflux transporter MFP subunit [Phaeovulum vinaykumarii]